MQCKESNHAGHNEQDTRNDLHAIVFGYLETELLEDGELKAPSPHERVPVREPVSVPKPSGKVYEAEVSDEDIAFAVFCMLEDMERLRLYIRRAWEKYHGHDVSLINASTCTNTALQLACHIEEAFLEKYPQFSDWTDVLELLFPMLIRPDEDNTVQLSDLDTIHYLPYSVLLRFRDVQSKGILPLRINDYYDPSEDISVLPILEIRKRDMLLLQHILSESLPTLLWSTLAKDQITMGLHGMVKTKKLRLGLVFAMQVLLDIHHMLGELIHLFPSMMFLIISTGQDVRRGLQDLHAAGNRMEASINAFLQSNEEIESTNDELIFQGLRWHTELMDKDIIKDAVAELREKTLVQRAWLPLFVGDLFSCCLNNLCYAE